MLSDFIYLVAACPFFPPWKKFKHLDSNNFGDVGSALVSGSSGERKSFLKKLVGITTCLVYAALNFGRANQIPGFRAGAQNMRQQNKHSCFCCLSPWDRLERHFLHVRKL